MSEDVVKYTSDEFKLYEELRGAFDPDNFSISLELGERIRSEYDIIEKKTGEYKMIITPALIEKIAEEANDVHTHSLNKPMGNEKYYSLFESVIDEMVSDHMDYVKGELAKSSGEYNNRNSALVSQRSNLSAKEFAKTLELEGRMPKLPEDKAQFKLTGAIEMPDEIEEE